MSAQFSRSIPCARLPLRSWLPLRACFRSPEKREEITTDPQPGYLITIFLSSRSKFKSNVISISEVDWHRTGLETRQNAGWGGGRQTCVHRRKQLAHHERVTNQSERGLFHFLHTYLARTSRRLRLRIRRLHVSDGFCKILRWSDTDEQTCQTEPKMIVLEPPPPPLPLKQKKKKEKSLVTQLSRKANFAHRANDSPASKVVDP